MNKFKESFLGFFYNFMLFVRVKTKLVFIFIILDMKYMTHSVGNKLEVMNKYVSKNTKWLLILHAWWKIRRQNNISLSILISNTPSPFPSTSQSTF